MMSEVYSEELALLQSLQAVNVEPWAAAGLVESESLGTDMLRSDDAAHVDPVQALGYWFGLVHFRRCLLFAQRRSFPCPILQHLAWRRRKEPRTHTAHYEPRNYPADGRVTLSL